MLKIAVFAAAILGAAPAAAGCANYDDGSLKIEAPRARICLAGKCEETALAAICSTATWTEATYGNGWETGSDEAGDRFVKRAGKRYDQGEVSCSDLDDGGACDGF